MTRLKRTFVWLQEFSIPLILGVFAALAFANINPELYSAIVHAPLWELPGLLFGHAEHHAADHAEHSIWTIHFLINDIFMALFFGIAAKEITEACLPGGSLNPVSKALNPLCATLGGVIGPVGMFFALNAMFGTAAWTNGWGIPTATDIALAWLVARLIFGAGHPAVSFLLLLAVADDAIGLGIIAVGYPDPNHPTQWANLWWLIPGMSAAFLMRKLRVDNWVPYIAVGGACCWWGLYSAHLHPALALVFVVPFIPGPKRDHGLFKDDPELHDAHVHHSPLEMFEHRLKPVVDVGLFFFAFANAGVPFAGVNGLTWIVLTSLIAGKMLGITLFSWVGVRCGLKLPEGMGLRDLVMTSCIAGLGLTVALFVSGQAFTDPAIQGAARMGAVFSGGVAALAFALKVMLGVGKPMKLFSRLPGGQPSHIASSSAKQTPA